MEQTLSLRDYPGAANLGTKSIEALRAHDSQEPRDTQMEAVKVIGFDIAKSVFQVHGINAERKVFLRRQLKRRHVLSLFQ
jgi:hypothetical protein